MLADLRHALRGLARSPALTAVAVVTLALGLGAAAVVAVVAHALLLRPLPFPEPDRLVEVWPQTALAKEELVFLRDHTRSFAGPAGYWPWSAVSLTGDGEPESLAAAEVTADFFEVLGVQSALGRAPVGGDGPEPPRSAVLSDGLWRRRFGADPEVVGKPLTLDGGSWRVAGVMPPGFRFPHAEVEVWLPMVIDPGDEVDYRANYLSTVARLAPGVSEAYPDDQHRVAFHDEVERRLAAVPGVRSAGGIHMVPVANQGFNTGFLRERDVPAPGEAPPRVNWRVVTPGYFATLGIPLLAGRGLEPGDRAGAPEVALVNRTLAERFWPGAEPVGRRFRVDVEGPEWVTVVGVIGNVRQHGPALDPLPEVYRPAAQNHRPVGLAFMVRTAGDPAAAVPALRRAVWQVHPDAPVSQPSTMIDILDRANAEPRLLMRLLGFFAALALLLGALGVYGVLAHEVQRRTREIGLRVALGAQRGDVVRLVVRRALALVAIGGALGVLAMPALGRLLTSLLFEVAPGDPATVAAALAILGATAAVAGWVPARRALRLDPVEALRTE
jgi:hypothetical protein